MATVNHTSIRLTMKILSLLIIALLACTGAGAQDTTPPVFSVWLECVDRGPEPGRAFAEVSYSYSGSDPIVAEDSRMFGDTKLGETEVFEFRVMPGQHLRETHLNVGADKVITWKVILYGELYVVTLWDNPEIQDCAADLTTPAPTVTPVPQGGSA